MHLDYEVTVTSTTGAFSLLAPVYLNSVSDPTSTGGSRRPRYYSSLLGADETTAPYGHYKVMRVRATVEGASNDAKVYRVGWVSETAGSSAPESMAELGESPYSWVKLVGLQDSIVKHTQVFDMAQLHGVSRAAYRAEDAYGADAGSNASPAIQLHLAVQAAAAQTVTWTGFVHLDFEVELSELRDVNDS